jgi:hypothetical protein
MTRYTGPPMDLTNMRSLGVTKVDVYCGCGHNATIDVSALPGDLAVPDRSHPPPESRTSIRECH